MAVVPGGSSSEASRRILPPVSSVIQDTHIINGRQRAIPRNPRSKDVKTKKIFVGHLPETFHGDELKDFFSRYGNVVDHQVIRDHRSNRSRGFGFFVFDSEQTVDDLLSHGPTVHISGVEVVIEKAEQKKPLNMASGYHSDYSSHILGESPQGLLRSYGGYRSRGVLGVPGPSRIGGGREGYGGEYGSGYGGGHGYRAGGSFGYSARHDAGMSGGYLGGYRHGEVSGSACGGGGCSSVDYGGPEYGSGSGFGPVYEGGRGGFGRTSSGRHYPYRK